MVEALLWNAALLIGVVLVLWAVSVWISDVSFIDAFWGAGMAMLAVASWWQLQEPGALATLLMVMTAAWGLRLGIYLLRRWLREGEDRRYRMILKRDREQGNFAMAALVKVWLLQAVLLFIVSSPAQYGILQAGSTQGISTLALLGLGVYLIGIFFEWVGDWQLARFKSDPANAGRVLDTGLWRFTRHPNYFGDFLAWWGIWIAAASAGWWVAAWTVIGPLFLSFTLTRWSGVTLLEKGMDRSKGDRYAEYRQRTPAFFPGFPR